MFWGFEAVLQVLRLVSLLEIEQAVGHLVIREFVFDNVLDVLGIRVCRDTVRVIIRHVP